MPTQEKQTVIRKHFGMADASSAIALGNDKFLVVCDERNLFVVYNAFADGQPLAKYDFSIFLDLDAPDAEADVEGSASVGEITYWIGSHSRNKRGRLDLNRHQFFATSIDDSGRKIRIRQVGQSYTNLLPDLLRSKEYRDLIRENLSIEEDSKLAPKMQGSLSIEGLTHWNGGILLGFRNPVPDGIALLAPVSNSLEMVLYGDRARFEKPIRLDLENRGIRSIDGLPGGKYLIAAGSYSGVQNPAYFIWDGKAGSTPRKYEIDLPESLNTEAVVVYDSLSGLQLLSDDGGLFKQGNVPDREKYFRSVWLDPVDPGDFN